MKLGDLGYTVAPQKSTQAEAVVPQHFDKLSGQLAQTGAIVRAGEEGLLAIKSISDQRAKYQSLTASLNFDKDMAKWEIDNAKEYFSPEEVPADIQGVRRTEKVTDEYGATVEVPRERIPAYEVYPQMFKKQLDRSIEAAGFGIDRDDVRKLWTAEQSNRSNEHLLRVVTASVKAQQGAIRKDIINQIDVAAQAGNTQAVVALAGHYPGTREEQEVILRKGMHTVEMASIQNSIATGNLQLMEEHIARLSDLKQKSNLTGPEREAAVRELQQRSMQNVASKAFQDELRRDNAVLAVDAKIQAGNGSRQDVLALREAGIISRDKMIEMLHEIARIAAKDVKTKLSFVDVMRLQDERPGVSVVVNNTDNQKAVDEGYKEATANASGEQKFNFALSIARKTDYLPQPYRRELEAADRSQDPNAMFAAATQYMEIQRYSPQSLRDLKNEDTQNIRNIAAVLSLGGPQAKTQAMDYATRLSKQTPADKEAEKNRGELVSKYIEVRSPDAIVDYFSKRGDFGIRFVPFTGMARPSPESLAEMKKAGRVPLEAHTALPASGIAEYEVIFRQELVNSGGDAAMAEQSAMSRFAQRWRPTEVNGFGQIMRDLPRGVTDKVLREYIDLAHPGSEGQVFIMADKLTQAAVNANATLVPYQLYRRDDKGTPFYVGTLNFEPASFAANLAEMRVRKAASDKGELEVKIERVPNLPGGGEQARRMAAAAKEEERRRRAAGS